MVLAPLPAFAAVAFFAALVSSTLGDAAWAQPAPSLKPLAVGTPVTLARPTDADEVLLRLVGVQCVATTKLARNADGSFEGSVTCGAVTIKGKRLAIDTREAPTAIVPRPAPTAMSDARIASGQVTILAIGPNDLFLNRSDEIVGKVCNVTKPLMRGSTGFYAGELTCGNNRYYFAEVSVASGSVQVLAGDGLVGIGALAGSGPQVGERWRILDPGDVYPSINTTDCIAWPTSEIKRKGGDAFWGAYAPAAGDIGLVLGVARHCSQSIDVVLLQIGAFVVPIGVQGVERAP